MDTFTDTVQSLWQVLAIGLLFGAGIPMFAIGIRVLSPADTVTDAAPKRDVAAATVAGYLCSARCVVAVVTGVLLIMKDSSPPTSASTCSDPAFVSHERGSP